MSRLLRTRLGSANITAERDAVVQFVRNRVQIYIINTVLANVILRKQTLLHIRRPEYIALTDIIMIC